MLIGLFGVIHFLDQHFLLHNDALRVVTQCVTYATPRYQHNVKVPIDSFALTKETFIKFHQVMM